MSVVQTGRKSGSLHAYKIGRDDLSPLVRAVLREVTGNNDVVTYTVSTDIRDGQIKSEDIDAFIAANLPNRLTNFSIQITIREGEYPAAKYKYISLDFNRYNPRISVSSPNIAWALGHYDRIIYLLMQYRVWYYFLYITSVNITLGVCNVLVGIVNVYQYFHHVHNDVESAFLLLFACLLFTLTIAPLILPRNQISIRPPNRFTTGGRVYACLMAVVAIITAIFAIIGPLHK